MLIVGAGLTGLNAAVHLHDAGIPCLVVEQSDGVGGRARTDCHPEGFLLDRGAHVLLTGLGKTYDYLDFRQMDLQYFDNAFELRGDGPRSRVIDPFAHPDLVPTMFLNSGLSLADALRLLRLKLSMVNRYASDMNATSAYTAREGLARWSFSQQAIDGFFAPLSGALALDVSLSMNAQWFLTLFRALSGGRIALPAAGIGALAAQLATKIPPESIRLNVAARSLVRDVHGRVCGVETDTGVTSASFVVLATDAWSARQLDPRIPDLPALPAATVYLTGAPDPTFGRSIVLNTRCEGFVNDIRDLSRAASSYAPPGKRLLACTTLVAGGLTDAQVAERALLDVRSLLHLNDPTLRPLAVYATSRAVVAHPPGWRTAVRRANPDGADGVIWAGEYTQSSSIAGALDAGYAASRQIRRLFQ